MKYVGGHSDLMMGSIVTTPELRDRLGICLTM